MFTIGTSAYLKILSLSDRPQRTELKKRVLPRTGGYDFHKSLRRAAKLLLADRVPIEEVMASLQALENPAERKSALSGIRMLAKWRQEHGGGLFDAPVRFLQSPQGGFKIGFEPDFGIVLDGRRIAVHVWNTKSPSLVETYTVATLSLFAKEYPELEGLTVLRLSDMKLISSEVSAHQAALGQRLMAQVESVLVNIRNELSTARQPPKDHPTPPPPL